MSKYGVISGPYFHVFNSVFEHFSRSENLQNWYNFENLRRSYCSCRNTYAGEEIAVYLKIYRASAFKCCFFMDFQANQNRPSGFNQNKIYGNLNLARYDGVKS